VHISPSHERIVMKVYSGGGGWGGEWPKEQYNYICCTSARWQHCCRRRVEICDRC